MPDASSPVASRANLLDGYRALAALLVVLVLFQAWMAGQSNRLFGDLDIVAHGIVGNVSYLVAVAVLVLTLVVRADKVAITVAAGLVVVMTVQIGLGYTGRESLEAAAWHVPIGVAIFGLSVYQLTVAGALRRSSRRATADPGR